jgi:hypothetical protein
MKILRAHYSHPLCGCTQMGHPVTVEIDADADWPELQCRDCGCVLRTSGTVTVSFDEEDRTAG